MKKLKFNKNGLAVSRRLAAEASVLLRNEGGALPLKKGEKIALFGRNQCDTFKGGGGAADLWAVKCQPYCDGLEELCPVYKPLLKTYRAISKANYDPSLNKFHNSFNLHRHYLPEARISGAQVDTAAAACDTAVVFFGRFVIEGVDQKDERGQYRLTEEEEHLLGQVTETFKKTVLVLNVPGAIDLSFLDRFPVDAIVHNFYPGHLAGYAMADILYGKVPPCGRLPFSWAKTLAEYPTNEGFATEKIVYSEGLYMGYRYFDTFQKEVVFPFGFGLSYTTFEQKVLSCEIDKTVVTIKVAVTNAGGYRGREVVQCYLSAPDGRLEKPYQVLCDFQKTGWLKPGDTEAVTLRFDLLDFTSYCEEYAAYILEKGDYILRVGRHSRDTAAVCTIAVGTDFVHKKVLNRLTPPEPVKELKKTARPVEATEGLLRLTADCSALETRNLTHPPVYEDPPKRGNFTFSDVMAGRCTPEDLAACLNDEQLALLMTGDGFSKQHQMGVDEKPIVDGEGTHTHQVTELGIPSSVMQDGPNGVRGTTYLSPPLPPDEELSGRDCVYYPCATAQAATWDRELLEKMGREIAVDLDKIGYNGLCAPGVNLQRSMLCGRNFEYFSEDPYLAAQMAAAVIRGVQFRPDGTPTGRYAVLKHFACNNSEQKRLVSDSILTERTARELYLRTFEYVLQLCEPGSIMTAYNKLNGEYAAARADLLDGICRYEWGYTGWIMTDWGVLSPDGACLAAGVDTCMPGFYRTMEDLQEEGLTSAVARVRAANLIRHLAHTNHYFDGKRRTL